MPVITEEKYIAEIICLIMQVAERAGNIIAPYDEPATVCRTFLELDCAVWFSCVAEIEFPFGDRFGTVVAGFRVCLDCVAPNDVFSRKVIADMVNAGIPSENHRHAGIETEDNGNLTAYRRWITIRTTAAYRSSR